MFFIKLYIFKINSTLLYPVVLFILPYYSLFTYYIQSLKLYYVLISLLKLVWKSNYNALTIDSLGKFKKITNL